MPTELLSHLTCQRQLRARLDEITPAEALPFERLAAIVTDDTELWSIAEQGPLGPEAELHELIIEYGERLGGSTRSGLGGGGMATKHSQPDARGVTQGRCHQDWL